MSASSALMSRGLQFRDVAAVRARARVGQRVEVSVQHGVAPTVGHAGEHLPTPVEQGIAVAAVADENDPL